MMRAVECWTAETLLPLLEDGRLEPEVRSWLESHRARCPRHARTAWKSLPAPECDAQARDRALERILRAFDRPLRRAPAPRGWLGELLLDWRAAPLPMAALSALSLALAFATGLPRLGP